jgi:diphthine-ammonia ligase
MRYQQFEMEDARSSVQKVCCSWSGGKDSCLGLHRMMAGGSQLVCLMTMFTESGDRSRSHGLARDIIEAHARLIGVPLLSASASWDEYECAFTDLLRQAGKLGATASVFGDIDIPRHRQWEENVCQQAGLCAELPLWQHDRLKLLDEWWSAGFEARIVVAREGVVDRRFLGRVLDRDTAAELTATGIDPCGENGEFHTVVTSGPLFPEPLRLDLIDQHLFQDCWFQDFALASR